MSCVNERTSSSTTWRSPIHPRDRRDLDVRRPLTNEVLSVIPPALNLSVITGHRLMAGRPGHRRHRRLEEPDERTPSDVLLRRRPCRCPASPPFVWEPTSSRTSRLTCHGGGGLNPRHAPPRGRVRATGVGRRGGLAPLRARGSARARRGQTLVNVMKARAAALDVLVDLADSVELRAIGFSSDGLLEIGATATYAQVMGLRGRGRAADPGGGRCDDRRRAGAEIAAIAGGNVCVSDPTNHLPPLVAPTRRSMIRGPLESVSFRVDAFFVGVYVTSVGVGESVHEDLGAAGERCRRRVRRHRRSARDGTSLTLLHCFRRRHADRDRVRSCHPGMLIGMEEACRGRLLRRHGARSREGAGRFTRSAPPTSTGRRTTGEAGGDVREIRAVLQAVERRKR